MANAGYGLGRKVGRLFGGWLGGAHEEHPSNLDRDRHYVSDYTRFMDRFLEEHPEEIEEQRTGWNIWWAKDNDPDAQARSHAATAPDDGYGFYASAWRRHDEPSH